MQRVRVGLTGLGAVLLIVAISAAIFESARNKPPGDTPALNKTEQTVANIVAANATEAPADPLTEIGVTPAAPAANATDAATPAAK